MDILITGAAGFMGYHLCSLLLKSKNKIFAIDNLNNSYDISLKKARLQNLKKNKNFFFYKLDINSKTTIN